MNSVYEILGSSDHNILKLKILTATRKDKKVHPGVIRFLEIQMLARAKKKKANRAN